MTTADDYLTRVLALARTAAADTTTVDPHELGRRALALDILDACATYHPQEYREGQQVRWVRLDVTGTVTRTWRADDGYGRWIYEVDCPDDGDRYTLTGDDLELMP